MFTGIVEAQGTLLRLEKKAGHAIVHLAIPSSVAKGLRRGESLALNGVCLTVRDIRRGNIQCDLLKETLARTNLGGLCGGDSVNLERALEVGDRMGGHFLTGHVDAVGQIKRIEKKGRDRILTVQFPVAFHKYLVPKGCIGVDGISLTVVHVGNNIFTIHLIPHTLRETTLGRVAEGDKLNLEFDIMAKYLWQWMQRKQRTK